MITVRIGDVSYDCDTVDEAVDLGARLLGKGGSPKARARGETKKKGGPRVRVLKGAGGGAREAGSLSDRIARVIASDESEEWDRESIALALIEQGTEETDDLRARISSILSMGLKADEPRWERASRGKYRAVGTE